MTTSLSRTNCRYLFVIASLFVISFISYYFLSGKLLNSDGVQSTLVTLRAAVHTGEPERERISTVPDGVCPPGEPCDKIADGDIDFRITVITFNRAESLAKLFRSLDGLQIDGDRAIVEIWIDVDKRGRVDVETERVARTFRWKHGRTRVHVQPSNAGIMGQWIDTWRPRPESRELGLILEDDIDVAPMAYRWLKAVHRGMANRTDFVGATLTSDQMSILSSSPKGPLAAPKNDTVVMYKCFGTWGFSPKPEHWRRFQVYTHTCGKTHAYTHTRLVVGMHAFER